MAAFIGISLVHRCRLRDSFKQTDIADRISALLPSPFTAIWKTLRGRPFRARLCALLIVDLHHHRHAAIRRPAPESSRNCSTSMQTRRVKYALAVGAAATAVGIVVGVINTTGIGFPARLHGHQPAQGEIAEATRTAPRLGARPTPFRPSPRSSSFLSLCLHRHGLHPDGGRPADDGALHHAGDRGSALAGAARRATPGLTSFRALLRGDFGDYAPVCASAYAAAGSPAPIPSALDFQPSPWAWAN